MAGNIHSPLSTHDGTAWDSVRGAVASGSRRAELLAELGAFLRARRDRLQPEDVGLPRDGTRRVRGLRREEVASLASVSVSLYAWLEQGRPVDVSPQVLDAICRALQLTPDERVHVRRLAGRPIAPDPVVATTASLTLQELVADLSPSPACIVSPSYDLLTWNPVYAEVFGDPVSLAPPHRNVIWMAFADESRQAWITDGPARLPATVAWLRAERARVGDERLRTIIDELNGTSPTFRDAWTHLEVREEVSQHEVLEHPRLGTLRLRVLRFVLDEEPSCTLIVHHPACKVRGMNPGMIGSPMSPASGSPFMSAPAQNPRPAPVSTITRTEGSPPSRSNTWCSSAMGSLFSALRRSGRFVIHRPRCRAPPPPSAPRPEHIASEGSSDAVHPNRSNSPNVGRLGLSALQQLTGQWAPRPTRRAIDQ